MLFWTLQTTIISIILIFLVHNLFSFFKSTLTIPKIKDLVNAPTQKYENMFNVMSKNNLSKYEDNENDYETENNDTYLSAEKEHKNYKNQNPNINSMKNELKDFLKTKLKEDNKGEENSTSISSLDTTNMNSLSYSEY
jgi:hypothetical protein